MPRAQGGRKLVRALDRQILEPRPDARRVDDAVAHVAARKRHVRRQRGLDQVRVGVGPDDPGQHADVAALDEAEAAGAAGDLRDLPRVQVAPLLAVELLRLREQERLAGKVDAVAEHVGGAADVGLPVHEALDLEPPRPERHRAVEDGDAARLPPVQLPGEREHGAAAERDDDGAGLEALEGDGAGPVERRLALEEADLRLGERVLDERQRLDGPEQEDVLVLAGEQQPRPGGAALAVVGPLHLVEHEHLAGRAAPSRRCSR